MSESIQRPGYESRVNLLHDAEPRAKVVLEGVAIFFCMVHHADRAGYDGDRFNAVRLFRVISEVSAERDSLDESCAFLIEGAQCGTMTSQMLARASFSAVCLTVFPFEFRPRTFTIGFYGKNSIISELMILECSFPLSLLPRRRQRNGAV